MNIPNGYYPYDDGPGRNLIQDAGHLVWKPDMGVRNPYYQDGVLLNQDLFREKMELQGKLIRCPNNYLVDERSLTDLAQSNDMGVIKPMNDHMMNSRYHEDTSEEKFKKSLHQFEELIHHNIRDCDFNYEMSQPVQFLPFSGAPEIMQMLPPAFDVSNSLNRIMNDSAHYGTLVDNSIRNSNSYRAVNRSFHNVSNCCSRPPPDSCYGNNICINETVKQDPFEVVPSVEPTISSVTAVSDIDRQSDNDPIDVGSVIMDNAWQYLPEVSSQEHINGSKSIKHDAFFNYQPGYHADHPLGLEGNMMLPYCSRASDQVVGRLSSNCKVYPSVFVKRTTSGSCNEEAFYSQTQRPGPPQRYHSPINLPGCQLGLQSQTCLAAPDELSKLVDSCNISSYDILNRYKAYKSVPVNISKFQVPFLSLLHFTNCDSNRCLCKQFHLLISHFDNCNDSSCNLCCPLFGSSGYNVTSAYELSNNSFSTVHGDDLPPAKRMRMGNLLSPDTAKLAAPRGSVPEKKEMVMQCREPSRSLTDSKGADVHQDVARTTNQQLVYSNTPYIADEVNQSYELVKVEQRSTSDMTCSAKVLRENHVTGLESKKKDIVRSGDTKSEATSCLIEHTDNTESLVGMQGAKKVCVSLIDILPADHIEEHVQSLKVTSEISTDDTLVHGLGESLCQLCAMGKLLFNPAPVYCSCCGNPVKRNSIYYLATDEIAGKHCFCGQCFRKSRGKSISVQGLSFCKSKLIKGKNVNEEEESWVQCDKCERWQHQICGLYNSNNDPEEKEKYVCPSCRLREIKIGEHMHLCPPPFGANDLPCTKLSDYIEQRLHRRLKEERQERAMSQGKCLDEVPGADNLVVRVVLSIHKLVKVKQQFLDIFHGKNYPAEFPYKSKVILLFQNIKGVDVCLFGMYVQEYGSDCHPPNRRSLYISYLDSVKYFEPQVRTVHGEALRTFVYHEILIGYLDYCKKLGFETCYIWACPPVKGEDYILNCHPETQKAPKSDKLRHWYKSMLLKATKENVVTDSTNFYDRFFVPTAQYSTKVTTASLPYFDGAYWSAAAEDQNRRIGKEVGSEELAKKLMSKRTLKSMGHTNLSGESATDILVMQKLGQAIFPVKEDFIVVHLQFCCSSCHKMILSPNHWICAKCKRFRVCPRCIEMEQSFSAKTHFIGDELHTLSEIVVSDIPVNTDDEDRVLDNDIFENRHSFLSFCQEKHYQFDSLRRAKYSSMMILHHLHQQISLGAVPKDSSMTECDTTNKRLQKQNTSMEEILKTLAHAFQCQHSNGDPCAYSRCSKLKKLFHHMSLCQRHVNGGCKYCKISWNLLHLHSRKCTVSDCQVPHCLSIKMSRDLKATQAENRRRAAIEGIVNNNRNLDSPSS